MSLKSILSPHVSQWITSADRLDKHRRKLEARRQKKGHAHQIEYFHDATDPYSCLVAQILPDIVRKFDVEIICHIVEPAPDWAAPDRERLHQYSRIDANRLAEKSGLWFQDSGEQPEFAAISSVENQLSQMIDDGTFIDNAGAASITLWQNTVTDQVVNAGATAKTQKKKQDSTRRRNKLGHYLGATLFYAGEWYWGLDRLAHLEQRLTDLTATRGPGDAAMIFAAPNVPDADASVVSNAPDLHFYLSFRSPYTYLAIQRVRALAHAYGASLNLRFVLPMVMRGLPVPGMKRRYIVTDAAREARRLGIPFGRINDPLGKPVERAYSLLPWAREQGLEYDYAVSFMRAVWAEGVDAGSDRGMRRIVEDAGLDWHQASARIGNDDWRSEAEGNRQEMMALGLWGVPAFRVADTATWGQDRLWVIEDALKSRQNSAAD